jgi:hypothetical protein
MDVYPKARNTRIVVQELEDETLVYDLDTNRAYCHNEMASSVWKECYGSRDALSISRTIKNADGEVGRRAVTYAIELLDSNGLLEGASSVEIPTSTRRDAIKKLAIGGAALLPVISMIVAPQPAHAASCVANNASCSASAQCCSNCCKNVGGGVNQCKPGGGACLP